MHDEPDWPETCRATYVTGGHDPYSTGCDLTPGHAGPHGGSDPLGGDGRVAWSGGGSAGGDPLPYRDVRWTRPVGTRPDTGVQPGEQGPPPHTEADTSDGDDPAGPATDAMNGVPHPPPPGAADPATGGAAATTRHG